MITTNVTEFEQRRVDRLDKNAAIATSNTLDCTSDHGSVTCRCRQPARVLWPSETAGQHQGTNRLRLVRFLPEDNLRVETLSKDQEQRLLLASPRYLRDTA